jgi:MFS family permease
MRAATTTPVVATAPRPALVVSTVANLAIQLDAIGMFAVYPEILRVFSGTPEATLSWVLNAYTIASAAFLVPAGRLADRFGRRVLFLTGTILYGLGAGLCGITPNPELLIAARIMQGLGAAMLIPTSLALVLVAFPSNRRAGAVNQWVAGGAIGGVIAPTLGGLIITTIGWRWFLSLSLLLGLLAFVFGRRYLVDSERDVCEPIPDILGLILLIAGLSLLALGIVRPDGLAVGGVGRTLTISLGGGVMGLFGLRSVRVPHPAISLSLLADPVRALASVAMLVFGITFTAMFLGWNLFLTRQWHFTSFEAGLAISLGPVTAMLTATVARRLADKFGHRSLLLPGAATYSASGILLVQAVAGPPNLFAHWLPAMVISGVGVGLLSSALSGLTVFGLPQSRFAVGAGMGQAIRQLGGVIGVALVIALLQALDPATAFRLIYSLMAGGGVIIALIALPVLRGAGEDSRPPLAQPVSTSSTAENCRVDDCWRAEP